MSDSMTTDNPLVRLGALGQSPWYDFITRDPCTYAPMLSSTGVAGSTRCK